MGTPDVSKKSATRWQILPSIDRRLSASHTTCMREAEHGQEIRLLLRLAYKFVADSCKSREPFLNNKT
jgi:hypothetical protein